MKMLIRLLELGPDLPSFSPVAVPLTLEKREDLLKKRENFKKNADQLDDQLMKLKVWIIPLLKVLSLTRWIWLLRT
jgi:hypothetical protein